MTKMRIMRIPFLCGNRLGRDVGLLRLPVSMSETRKVSECAGTTPEFIFGRAFYTVNTSYL
jgi:hypothetical protein